MERWVRVAVSLVVGGRWSDVEGTEGSDAGSHLRLIGTDSALHLFIKKA